MKNKSSMAAFLFGMALLIVGIINFLYWGNKKEVWFCDEIYTYESANGFEQGWPNEVTAEWLTGSDIEAFFAADSEEVSFGSITVRLYNDHVPLYFWLFRVVSLYLFKGSATIWIGLSINLFFYLLTLLCGYVFFWRITGAPWKSGVIMLLSCVVNRLMLQQATTLRMYMLLFLMEALLTLVALYLLRVDDKTKITPLVFVPLLFVSVIGFLTHYHFWVFYATISAVFCCWLLLRSFFREKKRFWASWEMKCVLGWVGNFILALLTTIAIFPYCRWNLNRGKGKTALDSLFVFSEEKIERIAWGFRRLSATFFGEVIPCWLGLLVIVALCVGGAVVLCKRKEYKKLEGLVLVLLITQVYQFFVCFTMPDANEERYLWGSFSLVLLCVIWCGTVLGSWISERVKGFLWGKRVVIAILLALIIVGEYRLIDNGNGIMYLRQQEKDIEVLKNHSDDAWVVYGPTIGVYSYYDWLIPEKICFVTHENTEKDARAIAELAGQDEFVLYLHENYYNEALEFFEKTLGVEITGEYLTQSTNLKVYLMSIAN